MSDGFKITGLAGFAVVALLLVVGLFSSCRTVDAGNVGVKRTFGSVSDAPLEPGLHFVLPFGIDRVESLNTQLKSYEVSASAASKDLQIVTTLISVQHSLNPQIAPASYSAIGDLEKFDAAIVSPAVMESLKAVTAAYTAEELITKREHVKLQVSDAIQAFINHTLAERKIDGALHVANVAIKDFNFSHEFNTSIEAKVMAQQEALRAQSEKIKRITGAEAAAAERKLSAEAEAYSIEKKSVQQAAAIQRESAAIAKNPSILQLRAIERWSGAVPQFMGGAQAVPFIDMQKLSSTN